MPLKPGKSRKVIAENFHTERHGKTFRRTEKKFGRKRALKQLQAIVLSNARKTGGKAKRQARKRR